MNQLPEKPVSTSLGSQRSMSESESSSASSSYRDSLHLGDGNTASLTISCQRKEVEKQLTDDGEASSKYTPPDVTLGNGTSEASPERNDSSKLIHVHQQPKNDTKKSKTVNNILKSLKEDVKVRESSPLRATRAKVVSASNHKASPNAIPKLPKPTCTSATSKTNLEGQADETETTKMNGDPAKRPSSHRIGMDASHRVSKPVSSNQSSKPNAEGHPDEPAMTNCDADKNIPASRRVKHVVC